MGDWTIDSLTEYLVSLFIAKNIIDAIIKKVDKVSHSLPEEEFLAIGVEKNGKDIHILLKVFDETKPNCWVENYEYKFNSRYIDKIIVTGGKNVKPV